ncbi:MAG: tetratricopeptide repeat protein, partial [Nitrospiraceae bacterium]
MAKKIKIKTKKPQGLKAFDIALQHYQSGNLKQAEMVCRQILDRQPEHSDTWHLLGVIAHQLGRHEAAIQFIKKAVHINSDVTSYYNDLGLAYAFKGDMEDAITFFKKALDVKENAASYMNLGNAYAENGMFDKAIESYKCALEFEHDNPDIFYNLGERYLTEGVFHKAIDCYRKATELRTDFFEAFCGLGNALWATGEIVEARKSYEMAVALRKDDVLAHTNIAHLHLILKDFKKGWEENEWRLKNIQAPPLTKPKWDGTSPKGKTILVYAEQGYGDTLQFVRYLPLLYKSGADKVLFKLNNKGLEQLLRESDLKAEILDAGTPVESLEYDTNIHLLSLPRIFKTNLENIPFRQKRYLEANPEKVEWYRSKFFT